MSEQRADVRGQEQMSDRLHFPPMMDPGDVAAELDHLLPGWRDMKVNQTRAVGSYVVERTLFGWAAWQSEMRAHREPRELGGYSRETAWSLSDYGLMRELGGTASA